ncbi:MAG: MerR family transcriptional regulator [Chitinivorax sp.]
MKIGELAQQAGCSVETIRYYEREGLLPLPGRTSGNYRHYDAAQLERLQLIRRCRTLDMTHDEIRTLLGYRDRRAGLRCRQRRTAINNGLRRNMINFPDINKCADGKSPLRMAECDKLSQQDSKKSAS